MNCFRFAIATGLAFALSACGVIYHVDVQQGNLLDKSMVDSLRPGMTKRQVELVMGSPSVISPFSQDRWDYVASVRRGRNNIQVKNLTLIFDGNILARMEGDFFSEDAKELLEESKKYRKQFEDDKPKKKAAG